MNEESENEEEMNPTQSNSYYRSGQDLNFVPTTREEERELFRRAKAGDEAARTFLITNHLLFAKTEAQKHGSGADEDELTSAANMALMIAIDQFDLKFQSRFTSYLKPFIWGEIARLWRSKNVVGSPRHIIPPKTMYFEDCKGDTNRRTEGYEHGEPDIAVMLLKALPMDSESVIENFNFDSIDSATVFKIVWDIAKKKLTDYELRIFTAVYKKGETISDFAKKVKSSRQAVWSAHGRGIAKITRELRRRKLLK